MRIPLFYKLFTALLLTSGLVITTMAVLVNASFKQGFQSYLNQEERVKVESLAVQVSHYYSQVHGWHRLEKAPHIWAGLLQQLGELPPPKAKRPRREGTPSRQGAFSQLSTRLNLLDVNGTIVLGPREHLDTRPGLSQHKIPIENDGHITGYIGLTQSDSLTNQLAQSFLHSQAQHLMTISLAVIGLSLLIAFICTRFLLTPLTALHRGATGLSQGDLDYHITHRGNDEIADVTQAFNQLAQSLKQQQVLRERWLADISHELRTPLAVLRGQLEALQDGIRPANRESIDALYQQVMTLTQLVDDLRSAAKSDLPLQLDLQSIDLSSQLNLISQTYRSRLHSKQITLELDITPSVSLSADQQKITQLINNVLENSYRYTDDGGQVQLSLTTHQNFAILMVEDSSPGVASESLPRLCERLYRVDQSRSRAFGGSGLGLSICHNIVQAHHGRLSLDHSSLGGLKVTIQLPLNPTLHSLN
ncbi:ATP-binding protein [Vibrio sp. WXL210]|uniref:ATP-binding protein n=1 Tax=Vibrio sp. WXL210 TaxID=3450709 RepID=UPI003EC85899